MRLTRCECGHDRATHFEAPDEPQKWEAHRGACLGTMCECKEYWPDEYSLPEP